MNAEPVPAKIRALERPDPALWTYYVIRAICTGPGMLVAFPYLYFRYHTLRYRFDEEGIHMKVGILFRREVNLTYSRIQDIHLRSGILQRWLGLGNVQIQTASGSSGPELVIEGFKNSEEIRDFLYTRMRGYVSPRGSASTQTGLASAGGAPVAAGTGSMAGSEGETIALLMGIRDELRRTRELLESRQSGPALPPMIQSDGTSRSRAG